MRIKSNYLRLRSNYLRLRGKLNSLRTWSLRNQENNLRVCFLRS